MDIKSEFVRGSITLFILLNIFNFLNYFFQFSMARMLSVAEYGIFSVLMSLIYMFNIPAESIQLTASKYSSMFHKKEEFGKLKTFVLKATKKALKYSLIFYVFFIPVGFFISWFLKIKIWLVLLTGSTMLLFLIVPINRGILQGRKEFIKMGTTFFSESIIKIIFGVLTVFIGWKVYGALFGIIAGLFFSIIISFFLIKSILRTKEEKMDIRGINTYGFWVFFTLFVIFLMLSLDVLLAKRFFSDEIVGAYAIISLMGKIIFFATMPIGKAMFPMTSGKEERHSKKTFYDAFKITILIGCTAVLTYFFAPELIIRILFGSKYLVVSGILWIIGLAYLFLSLANISVYYLLSLKKLKTPKTFMAFLIFPVIQLILLCFFNDSILEYSVSLLVSFSLMFFGSLLVIKYGKD